MLRSLSAAAVGLVQRLRDPAVAHAASLLQAVCSAPEPITAVLALLKARGKGLAPTDGRRVASNLCLPAWPALPARAHVCRRHSAVACAAHAGSQATPRVPSAPPPCAARRQGVAQYVAATSNLRIAARLALLNACPSSSDVLVFELSQPGEACGEPLCWQPGCAPP